MVQWISIPARNEGKPTLFVGINICRDKAKHSITLSQEHLVEKLVTKYHNEILTPIHMDQTRHILRCSTSYNIYVEPTTPPLGSSITHCALPETNTTPGTPIHPEQDTQMHTRFFRGQ